MKSRAAPTTTAATGVAAVEARIGGEEEADVENNDNKQMLCFRIVCGNKMNALVHLVQKKKPNCLKSRKYTKLFSWWESADSLNAHFHLIRIR